MKFNYRLCGLVALVFEALTAAHADVRLPKLFSNHMVLQRDLAVTVWGWAEPGQRITVAIAGQTTTATASYDGKWATHLTPLQAGGPYDLMVTGGNTITIKDVLVGDVWICAGQSNMEFILATAEHDMGGVDNWSDIRTAATNTQIRFLNCKGPTSPKPVSDVPNSWVVCDPQTAASMSAVGYFFGHKIQTETHIPIGLINTAFGGTRIEPWMNPFGLQYFPKLNEMLKEYEAQLAAATTREYLDACTLWAEQARTAQFRNEPPPLQPIPPESVASRSSLFTIFNGRIAPLTSYGIKGILWYQGESNDGDGDNYFYKLVALIGGWRAAWNLPPLPGDNSRSAQFPIYFVQLANYGQPTTDPARGDGYAAIRMAQLKALQKPHTGMAVAIDTGLGNLIHPVNKEDIGHRLALWALKNDYGQTNLVCSGPLYKGMQIEGSKIRISFDYVGQGLMVGKKEGHGPAAEDLGVPLQKFAIAGADKKWVWANAVIDGETLVVFHPSVPHPVAVRYAFTANPLGCNLYNKDGLPASPFRTDTW